MYTDVTVSITNGDQIIQEDVGSVEVCVQLDHTPLTPVSVTLTSTSGTAIGRDTENYAMA